MSNISKTAIDTTTGSMEAKYEITHGLSIGTMTIDIGLTLNHPRSRSQNFRKKYHEDRERYNVRHNGG